MSSDAMILILVYSN